MQQRIDSVLNQTYTDFEIIILDDCSIDNSREIIERYRSNEKISCIVYNVENSGSTFKQWDKGITLAKGKYIWIAESDDWCENTLVETLVKGIEEDGNVAFGYCQSFCVNNQEEIIFQSSYKKLEDYYSKETYLENFLTFGNAVFNSGMAIFRKEFYYMMSEFYKTFRFVGDWIFWAELSRLGNVYINAKPLNYFRKHGNDVSGKMYASGLNFIEEIKALDYFHDVLHLNSALYFKARIKLYNRFITRRHHIDYVLKTQVQSLLFSNLSFFQKQYFLIVSRFYNLKMGINKKISTSINF